MCNIIKKMSQRGQSTVEYVLLFAAVIAVLIVFLRPRTGLFSQSVNTSLEAGKTEMSTMTDRLGNAFK